MIVLLHFYGLGYSPFTLALLFMLYEIMGVFSNIIGGWLSTRFGINRMLVIGILLQIFSVLFLSAINREWAELIAVLWVIGAQGISGIAKDITKTASKSAIKLISPDKGSQLFKWVAWFTGSKNALKGAGFFAGGLLLETVGFHPALWGMALGLGVILIAAVVFLPKNLGLGTSSPSIRALFSKTKQINMLAAARIFLFGARDIWFAVGLPVFLYSIGWDFWKIGGFLALWTIGYGLVQAVTPNLIPQKRGLKLSTYWCGLLALVPIGILLLQKMETTIPDPTLIILGLSIFGLIFAVNSSLHSYLILAFAESKKAAEDVGFYYAANALGRLIGTFLSGLLYEFNGLGACLAGSGLFLVICMSTTLFINKNG
ncbi:MAG: hypothetical protein CFH06_01927 [Alphaproteobacteria bacterium MarineAlpha3_Bin5]|nr:MAG: hypothetical protein CFH06_01927 [Alphaproteobacteria bacterium MarineAlpha3_Bin5]